MFSCRSAGGGVGGGGGGGDGRRRGGGLVGGRGAGAPVSGGSARPLASSGQRPSRAPVPRAASLGRDGPPAAASAADSSGFLPPTCTRSSGRLRRSRIRCSGLPPAYPSVLAGGSAKGLCAPRAWGEGCPPHAEAVTFCRSAASGMGSPRPGSGCCRGQGAAGSGPPAARPQSGLAHMVIVRIWERRRWY